jgi:HAD superfamily hydrolase (TIGR01549 family)
VIAILDIDGTLVDSNYQHALAWFRALRDHGLIVPIWRIHRGIGMGGDQLVEHLCGKDAEKRLGDAVRERESEHYFAMIDEVQPLPGARELVLDLKQRGHRIVMASSAKEKEVDHYLDLLAARELAEEWTTSADVEQTKPHPELVQTALAKAGGGDAVMIGDSVWDVEAAGRAGVKTLAILTGGFSAAELEEAGAEAVYESIDDLRGDLDQTVLAAAG